MATPETSIDPAKIAAYRKAARLRQQARRERQRERHQRAWNVARRAAHLLREEFRPAKIAVFGSLLHPEWFHERSDVDLAVRGLEGREYFRAVGVLQSLDPEISVDLISFETAKSAVQSQILEEGEIL